MSAAAAAMVAQGGAAAALALGFALLAVRRMGASAAVCAAQMMAVAVAALMKGNVPVAAAEVAEALALAWWAGAAVRRLPRGERRAIRAFGADPGASFEPSGTIVIAAGAGLAALTFAVPGIGLALAVVLLGLLVLAGDRQPERQVLGLAAAQSGLVLSALAVGLSGWGLMVAVVPLLPVLAAAGLWLGTGRKRAAAVVEPRFAGWIDAAICCAALLGAATLPWQLGPGDYGMRLDARAAQMILLLCTLAAAGSWGGLATRPVWGSRLAVLAGTVLAVAAVVPLLAWVGVAVAASGAVAAVLPARTEAWRRLRLACAGLALALFGAIALHATPAAAAVAAGMLGYGSLAVLAPELAVAAVSLILRLPAPPFLLLTTGLAALAIGAAMSWLAASPAHDRSGCDTATPRDRRGKMAGSRPAMTQGPAMTEGPVATEGAVVAAGPVVTMSRVSCVGLAQGGVAVFAFGLGTPAGAFAGMLQLSLLALTQCAVLLSRADGLDRLAAVAGLGGIPPFGLFASLALVVAATAAAAPVLLLPLGVGLAAIAWGVLRRLPAGRRVCASPAWLPLALLLLCSFAMPASWLAWLRLAAR